MNLTPQLLRQATGCTADAAERFAEPLRAACAFYGIDTPTRLADFLAQIGHESASLRYTTELWGPTPAQQGYEGRADLGNTQPGDGAKFKGHGLMQKTGRDQHARVRDRLRERFPHLDVPDFEEHPELLAEPQWAALSAADDWDDRGLNTLSDAGRFVAIGRAINRGNANSSKPANGEADRIARRGRAMRALSQEPIPASPVQETAPELPQEPATMTTASDIVNSPLTKFALAAINPILAVVPEIAKLFMDKGTSVPERNVAAAVKVVEVAQQAMQAAGLEAPNAQAVAEAMSDPQARQVVREAVMQRFYDIQEAGGGGIKAAREAARDPNGLPFWKQGAFAISCVLLAMVLMLLVDVFYVHPASYDGPLRTQIVTAVLMGISIVAAFWLGSSLSSQRKDEIAARQGSA